MSDDFYRALEERFRASREVIRSRLEGYRPFLSALQSSHAQPRAFDIGCGRGEWLQLLVESGFDAQGVDLDDSMLAACHERGLNAQNCDALEALRARADQSLELISAFHVVEHLSFDYLRDLLAEVRRVLVPHGLLILETPNSENLIVGTSNFYLDPTHQRPVPALFLDFLCQYSGFQRRRILRLQEDPALLRSDANIGLWQVLYGVSPDYAIVAQPAIGKEGGDDPFAELFSREYGLSLEGLANAHDRRLQLQHDSLCADQQLLRDDLQRQQQAQVALQRSVDDLQQQCTHNKQRNEQLLAELHRVYASGSWRITRPLRALTRLGRYRDPAAIKHDLAVLLHAPLLKGISLLQGYPGLFRLLDVVGQARKERLLLRLLQIGTSAIQTDASVDPRTLRQLRQLESQLEWQIAPSRTASAGSRPRLAYVSPLPPERSGIADYSAELLPELAKHFDIDVIVDQPSIADDWIVGHCQQRDANWLRRHAGDYQAVLYHIGNSHYHAWMFELLQQCPGIVVLHDFYLGGLIWSLDALPATAGIKLRELQYAHGYSAVAECLLEKDEGNVGMRYPFNRSLLESASGVIVHSAVSLRLAQQWFGPAAASDWVLIPHLRQPAQPQDRHAIRKRLGLPDSAFVVCSFGLLGMTKLNHRLLDAWLASRLAEQPESWLIFVGEAGDDDYARQLRQSIESCPHAERIRITGWADSATFRDYLGAADLAVQLRTMSRGETSGTVLDCMNHALPTIVNANGSMADLPEDGVHRLPDDFSDAQLCAALEHFHGDPDARRQLGQRARRIIEEQHAPAQCAEQYRVAIERFAARQRQAQQHQNQALLQLLAESRNGGALPTLLDLAERLANEQPAPLQSRQLLLDISETRRSGRHTGIERVARALCLALLAEPPQGYRIEPVYLCDSGGHWHYRRAAGVVADLLGMPDHLQDSVLEYAPSDHLLILDIAGEAFIQAEKSGLYRALQARGVDCRVLLHDLLPVTRPEFFPPRSAEHFRAWLQAAARLDGFVAVSRTVAGELRIWLQAQAPERAGLPIGHSHHGADLAHAAPSRGLPAEATQLLERLRHEPSILMVGTLEPRKGYLQALEAFSELWAAGQPINLVIVGREGWQDLPESERRDLPQLMHLLREHPERGQHLVWLDGISDEYLEQLYAACSGLLAASWDEGFGLPLIEAAQHGLPILARDIPIFREVVGEHAAYFQAATPMELAAAIVAWQRAGFQPSTAGLPWLTWRQSARNLQNCLFGSATPTDLTSHRRPI